MSSSLSGINHDYEEVTEDNLPFKSKKEVDDARKKIAKIKNN